MSNYRKGLIAGCELFQALFLLLLAASGNQAHSWIRLWLSCPNEGAQDQGTWGFQACVQMHQAPRLLSDLHKAPQHTHAPQAP